MLQFKLLLKKVSLDFLYSYGINNSIFVRNNHISIYMQGGS